VHTKRQDKDYAYKQPKKLLGITIQKEGFYEKRFIGDDKRVTIEEIKSSGNCYIEGTKVYYKPHILMVMSNGNHIYKRFEFLSSLTEFLESDLLKDIKLIGL
jgi:hypothetical protein